MPLVSKCCCCCSLKYGYFTYGIICLIVRVCIVTTLYLMIPGSESGSLRQFKGFDTTDTTITAGYLIGWFISTSFVLFIALKGIIQKRSILMYPYIVVLIFEILVLFVTTIIAAATISLWYLLYLLVVGTVNVYAIICLISLYEHIKLGEKSHPMTMETVPLKTV